jgi:cell division protein FtsB
MLDWPRRVGVTLRLLRCFSPGRILLAATLIAAAYLFFSAGTNFRQNYRIASDETRMRNEVAELRDEVDQLKQIRDYLRTDDYVEYMARRVFGLVKPGETLVIVDTPDSTKKDDDADEGMKWWQRLFSR